MKLNIEIVQLGKSQRNSIKYCFKTHQFHKLKIITSLKKLKNSVSSLIKVKQTICQIVPIPQFKLEGKSSLAKTKMWKECSKVQILYKIIKFIIKQMSKYSIISQKRRLQLIDLVKKDKKTIVSAAKKLKIKISTAKSILYSFEKNGKVLKKKKHQRGEKPKNSNSSNLQADYQVNSHSQKEQTKKQAEHKNQENRATNEVFSKPLLMMNPVLFNPLWNYFPFFDPFQSFGPGNVMP